MFDLTNLIIRKEHTTMKRNFKRRLTALALISLFIFAFSVNSLASSTSEIKTIILENEVFHILVSHSDSAISATLLDEVDTAKLPLAEKAVDIALGRSTYAEATPLMTQPTDVTVTSANKTYFGRHVSEDPQQSNAHSTMQAYLVNTNVNSPKGYMSTYGEMSGAWYGGGNATKIELKNTLRINLNNSNVVGSISIPSGFTAEIGGSSTTYSSTQYSTGSNTQVHKVNVNERVLTNRAMDGSWLDWVEQQVSATFTIPNVSTKYVSNSIVTFTYSI